MRDERWKNIKSYERWKTLKIITFYFLMYQYILHKNSNSYNFCDFEIQKWKSKMKINFENQIWILKLKMNFDFQKWKLKMIFKIKFKNENRFQFSIQFSILGFISKIQNKALICPFMTFYLCMAWIVRLKSKTPLWAI